MGMFANFTDKSKEVESELNKKLELALEAVGGKAESIAKKNITDNGNVKTGRLRNSISHKVDMEDNSVYIGTNVEYAPYIEYGTGIYADPEGEGSKAKTIPWYYYDDKGVLHKTYGSRPYPFLRPAATNHGKEYKELAKKIMKQ